MYIEPQDLEMVKGILKAHIPEYEVWVFGSRVHGQHLKEFSDLDLAVITKKPMELEQYTKLKKAFSDSDLPIKVDVVDWAATDQPMRKVIQGSCEVIQSANPT